MRRIYNPLTAGDVTSIVQADLQAGRTFVTAYLYRWLFMIFFEYNPYGAFGSYTFTDADFPIFVNYQQISSGNSASAIGHWFHNGLVPDGLTFVPENISFDKLSYGVGFKDYPTEVTFGVDDTKSYPVVWETSLGGLGNIFLSDAVVPANLSLKQALSAGLFTECPFWIHQAIFTDFPDKGGTFLGTSLMFRGFIRQVSASASNVKIQLASLMDVFNEVQVPTQTITPNNRAIPYIPAATAPIGTDFGFVSATSPQAIVFSTSESFAANALQDFFITFEPAAYAGFPVFQSGYPAAPAFRIIGNTAPSGGFVTVYFASPVVIPSVPAAYNMYAQVTTTGGALGFPKVPPPEYSV